MPVLYACKFFTIYATIKKTIGRKEDSMKVDYCTIAQDAQVQTIEKKSKFIATVTSVTTQEEAETVLQQLRKKYYDATHNCFAYQVGEGQPIQKCSDDGEPQGTAGKPILDVLKGSGLTNILICVTRYFGGTLLGTGGLVRAYGHAAKEGLLAAGVMEKRSIQYFQLQMPYPLFGKVQYLLNEKAYTIKETNYTEIVSVIVEVREGNQDAFTKWLIEKTNAEVEMIPGEYAVTEVIL